MCESSPIATTQHFIRAHMEQRNLEEAMECLTDTVTWFGTGAFEIVRGKEEARRFLTEEIRSFPEGYEISFLDMTEMMLTKEAGTVFGSMVVTDRVMESQVNCRITATCKRCGECFLIVSLHMSFPTELQKDKEFYPLTIAAKKIQQIKDSIQMERELKEKKDQLDFANAEIQTIVSNIPGGVHRCPLFDKIHVDYISPGFEEMLGYTKKEIHTLFHDNYTMLLVEEDRRIFANAIRKLASRSAKQRLEYRMLRKDGTIIYVEDHFRSVRMEDGKMWGFGVATDVTTQHETLAQLRLLTDSIPGGLAVYEYSSKGLETIYFSDGVCNMGGYTREEYAYLANTDLLSMIFKEDQGELREKMAQVVAGNDTIDYIYRVHTKNEGYRWLNLRGSVVERLTGMIRVNAVLFDITKTKESEEKLRIRDEEYSLAIAQSGKTVYRYTLADKTAYMLQKTENIFGVLPFLTNVPDSIIERGMIAPESVEDLFAFYQAIYDGQPTGCVTVRRKQENGEFGWCCSRFTTLFNSIGNPISAVISIEDITRQQEQKLENEMLHQNEELFKMVVSHSDRMIAKYDIKTHMAYLQSSTAQVFGIHKVLHNVPYSCEEREIILTESIQTYVDFYEKLAGGAPTAKAIIKLRKNGTTNSWGWYRFDGSVMFDDKKQPSYAVVSFVEVTKQYEKELAYERIKKHNNRVSQDAMLYFEANLTEMKIERASGYWLSHIKHQKDISPSVLLETTISELVYPEDRKAIRHLLNQENLLNEFAHGKTELVGEYRILQKDEIQWICITVEMITDPYTDNVLVYILLRDIDQSKKKEMNILKQAKMDGLTDLYNKTTVEKKIKEALATGQNRVCALAIVDVDDLKTVNDTLGHMQGDRTIRAFADTLRGYFEENGIVGRIGGDEFLVFLKDIESEQKLKTIMNNLVEKLSELRVGERDEYHLHGSIGIVISNSGKESFQTLYKKADVALYDVKKHGKNNCGYYSADMKCAGNCMEK
ncbi:MAG: diguanylate cyclase [Lachnospiraceae bacterium]